MNPPERERLVKSVHDAIADPDVATKMIAGRKRSRRRTAMVEVATSVKFDTESSTHSTVLQVVAQDVAGPALRRQPPRWARHAATSRLPSLTLKATLAIDVFYLTRDGDVLDREELPALRDRIEHAIDNIAS